MSELHHDQSQPIRHGNAFPWKGILAGVGRMMWYALLFVCLVTVVLGIIVLLGGLLVDSEKVGDYF
jgi:hypothetical protein